MSMIQWKGAGCT